MRSCTRRAHSRCAQGSANSSLAGVVVDTAGGVVPGATITVKNNATASTFETVSNSTGAFSIPVLDPGHVHRDRRARRLQDRGHQRRPPAGGDAREHPGSARSRQPQRDGRSQRRHRARPDAVVHGVVDDHDRADHEPAARLAQRAQLRRVPARSRNVRRPAGLDDQRPAAERDQRHLRRRQREQQLPVDRRLLFDGHAAPRRRRGSHRHGRDANRRPGGARRRAGRVRDPLGHQQLRRQPLPLLPPPGSQLELLLQQDPWPRAQRRRRPPVRRPHRRADRHPGPARRPEQGVLLLQHGGVLPADRGVAHADDPAPAMRRRAGSATT